MPLEPPESYVNISKRISLPLASRSPSEPTDTIVFTVGSYYVDLRVKKSDETIDWAFAGKRKFSLKLHGAVKCRWHHHIDSHWQTDPDEGTFSKLPNGDDLEVGSMACPEKDDQITDYEEVWRDVEPIKCLDVAWILESEDGKAFLARIGGGYIGVCETPAGFGARREEWNTERGWGWKTIYEIGECAGLPSFKGMSKDVKTRWDDELDWKVGDSRNVWAFQGIVRAFSRLP